MRARLTPLALVTALQASGRHDEAAQEAVTAFRNAPNAELAARIATSLSAVGDHDGAGAWMTLAEKLTLPHRG
jgi:hypothetical protein